MKEQQVIQKTRTGKEIFSVSLQFMSSNAKNLVIGAGIFALPLILTGILVAYLITDSLRSFSNILFFKRSLDKNYFVLFLIAYLVYILGIGLLNLGVNKILLRAPREENEENDFLSDFKEELPEDLKNFALSFVIVYTLYMAASEAINYLPLDANASGYALDIQSYFGSLLGSLLLYSPVIIVLSACFYFSFTTLFFCFRDKLGVTEALAKVWHYTSLNPVKAMTTSFVLLLACFLINNIFLLFMHQIEYWMYLQGISPRFLFITYCTKTIVLCALAIYFNISTVFLIGSLEDEADGLYIKSKIENIDNND